jgi:hypothetical protein
MNQKQDFQNHSKVKNTDTERKIRNTIASAVWTHIEDPCWLNVKNSAEMSVMDYVENFVFDPCRNFYVSEVIKHLEKNDF